jgi:hypothetical protein
MQKYTVQPREDSINRKREPSADGLQATVWLEAAPRYATRPEQ